MCPSVWKLFPTIVLIATPLGAQIQPRTIGSILDPALGTRVSVEAVKAANAMPAAIVITVYRPADAAVIRLSIPTVASLASLSDSVFALPARIGPTKKSVYLPIYAFPLDSGSTLTASRFVTEQGDLMQIQVNTAAPPARPTLPRARPW
jgi:hypothetical protein